MSNESSSYGDDGARRAWIGVGVPILGLIFIVIMLAVATLAGFARQQDKDHAESATRLAAGGVDGRAQTITSITLDYANWDEAFEATSVHWDQAWVEGNIYSGVADAAIIFTARGVARYVWFSDDSAPLAGPVQAAAAAGVHRIPDIGDLAWAETPAETVVRTFVRAGGNLAVVAVAPLTAEDDQVRLSRSRDDRTDYLAFVDIITAEELAAIGAARELRELAFVETQPNGADFISRPIAAADGRVIGYLVWRHAHPGAATFSAQIWPMIIGLLCIGALAILIARLLVTHQVRAIASARDALGASRAKSEFLTRVSPELRTPLNAIIGYAEMIQEDGAALETRTDAGRIITAARHLSHLLNDIIDQSRADSGRIKFTSEVLPVAGMLAEVQSLLTPSADTAGVKLQVSSSPLADFVYADHVRLRQCLLNIIGNAIKFSPRGATVAVRARLDRQAERSMVVFDIVDAGIGIAEGEMGAIFHPFGQANAWIGKTFGGAGLGLSISRELARQMGGDISAESEHGVGSTFSLAIPAATASAVKAA
jgi:signal transduction histidine kinase